MTRQLRLLLSALLAAFAMSSALNVAAADVLTAEGGPVTITGDQDSGTDVFKVHGGEAKCSTVKYTGSSASSSSQVTVTPTYSNCTFAGLAASVNMNGCDFLIRLNPAAGNTTGTLDLVCSGGKEMTITAPSVGTPKCTIHIPPQTVLGPANGTNVGSGSTREVTVDVAISNISYSQTAGTAETGNCATADNTTGGGYTGKARFTGEISGAHIGIFLS